MNIFWLTQRTDETPHKTSRLELSEALRRRGHEVTLVMARNFREKKDPNKGILYFPTFHCSVLSVLFFGLLISFYFPFKIRKKKKDIIMVDMISLWLPFVLTSKLFHVPLILDIRTLPIDKERSLLFDIALYISKYTINEFTTITPELKEILKQKYKLQDKKIGVWSSGASIKNFTKPSVIKDSIKIINDPKSFVLMYHGSYSSTRGIENLIKSIKELKNDLRKSIELIIIGFSQDIERKLTRLCEEIGVKEQVKFIPQVKYEEIASYISMSNVGIYPLPPENEWWQVSSPLKTLEYLAMGKPVIVTNIPFHKRVFEKGECGVLLDTNSPKALANAITYLYENKDKLDIMGKNGREIVENYYTWDIKASEVEEFLLTVLAKN